MYIRTKLAWYLLEEPSEFYRKAFASFWVPHRLSQSIADFALKHPDQPYEQFSDSLANLSVESLKMVGRVITADDVDLRVCLYSYRYCILTGVTVARCHPR